MLDLDVVVCSNGGFGLFYWELAWVSMDCYMFWGQGLYKENVIFFDFSGVVLDNGGMDWFSVVMIFVEL